MNARGIGGFLLTLVAAGYLFGPAESTLELLIGLLIAGVVGVAANLWLDRDLGQEPDVFDERATRRAVRRGVLRTSLAAVVWVAAGWAVAYVVTGVWQLRGDRQEHFHFVVLHGFNAANPGFEQAQLGGCCSRGLRSLEVDLLVRPRSLYGPGPVVTVPLRLDLRGGLEDDGPSLPHATVEAGGGGPGRTKEELRTLLDQLPDALGASALIELTRPLKTAGVYALLSRHGIGYRDNVAVFLQPRDYVRSRGAEFDGRWVDNRVSWPSPALAEFQSWAKQLRGSDDRLLDDLRLPSSSSLRRLAADPLAYGLILYRATPGQLRGLLAEAEVDSVSVGEVAFLLGTGAR